VVIALQAALAVWVMGQQPTASTGAVDPLAQIEHAQQVLFDQIAPAVVFIKTRQGFGSGFIVSRDGLVLTNAHVVGKHKSVDVVMHDGKRFTGTVVRSVEKSDLALVQLPLAKTVPLRLGDGKRLRVGQWLGAVGHGHGGIWTFNTGMLSNIYPASSDQRMFQTQIPLNPGASGGPIFDRTGAVIGVVTSGIVEAASINFGVAIDVALEVLGPLAARCDCLVVKAPKDVPIFVDGVMRGAGPRLVIPVTPGPLEVVALIANERRKVRLRFPEQRTVDLASGGARAASTQKK
jgi:serine protease Do